MKYLVLVYGNEDIWNMLDPEEFPKMVSEVDAYNKALTESGEMLTAQGLVVAPKNVKAADVPVATDGPYLESKEFVGSYYVLDVDSEERALEIATSYPALKYGKGRGGLEVWPLMSKGANDE